MAKCDQGYLCQVCGEEVKSIGQSSLYLRFVIGQVPPEMLHKYPERHIRCDPELAQFIVDEQFAPLFAEGAFDKRLADPETIRPHEQLVTRGWKRLKELVKNRPERITDYPLPEVKEQLRREAETNE